MKAAVLFFVRHNSCKKEECKMSTNTFDRPLVIEKEEDGR